MALLYFSIFYLGLVFSLFFMHRIRIRLYTGPYVMLLTTLWYLIYVTGRLDYHLSLPVWDGLVLEIHFSSALYTLVLLGILLVYVCEGVFETQNLILVSVGAQAGLFLSQIFLYHLSHLFLDRSVLPMAETLFAPSYGHLAYSVIVTLAELFFAIMLFQFLTNRLASVPLTLNVFLSLVVTMSLDSILLVSNTNGDGFLRALVSHTVFKTLLLSILSWPFSFYIHRFRRDSRLDLRHGSLDIFTQIRVLRKELEIANVQLRKHAEELEETVRERTQEIEQKQALLNLEMEMAADLQKAMLPDHDRIHEVNKSIAYIPCSAVSGDLYDMGRLNDDNIYIFLADISGHGVPSALVSSMVTMSLSRIDIHENRPAHILLKLNEDLNDIGVAHFLTSIFVHINHRDRVLTYASGGHIPQFLVGPSGKILDLEATGPFIGLLDDITITQKQVHYKAGTRLILYTDCILEHKNGEGEIYGPDRIRAILSDCRGCRTEDTKEKILREVQKFGGGAPFKDDLTLIVVDLP